MLNAVKQFLKRSKTFMKIYMPIHESVRTRLNSVNDVLEHYLPSHHSPQLTPYGFLLTTSRSIHHRGMLRGKFETEEVKAVQNLLDQIMVFVDVGANIGFYSCIARARNKHVVSIEPLDRNLRYLYANLSINGWDDVEVFPVGLGSRPGLQTMYSASGTAASLVAGWGGFSKRICQTIAMSTLDTILGRRFEEKQLFIKVDVEGSEYELLRGASHLLVMQPKPVWLIEVCLGEHHPGGLNPRFADTFELFWSHNYLIKPASNTGRIITPSDLERWILVGKTDVQTSNYLMIGKSQQFTL